MMIEFLEQITREVNSRKFSVMNVKVKVIQEQSVQPFKRKA